MDFSVDKKKVSEGDIVEINWSCPQAANATITLDSGYKSSSMEVENQGVKKFRLNRSKGSTTITVSAVVDGKSVSKSKKIRVKAVKEKAAKEKKYDSYENLSNHPFREKLRTWKSQLSYSWKALPPQKKQAYIVVLAICVIMIGASFYPPITYFGLCAISFYLLWTLMRR